MKKVINIMIIISLGVFIFWGISSAVSRNKQGTAKVTTVNSVSESSAMPARYVPIEATEGPDFTIAAEKTIHAVVHIKSEFTRRSSGYDDFFGPFRDFFGDPFQEQDQTFTGFGSGVIISQDGYIVTNNHVVDGASSIEVTLNDKHTYQAEVVGSDAGTDLAVIRIPATNLPFITYGNSDDVKIGQWVLAVGNPFNLTSTVTAGIVSAKARNINILGSQGAIESFIQTDAAVNRGNSGGALVNLNGELIGINAAIASNTGSYTGYSFAIPVNIVKKAVKDILKYGEVQRAYIGVVIQELDSKLGKEKGISDIEGVYVQSLSDNGGAKTAGIKEGDVITSINSIPTNTTSELLEVIGQHNPGDVVAVNVTRDGRPMTFQVELKNDEGSTAIAKTEQKFYISDLGATFEQVPSEEQQNLKLSYGLKIASLEDGMLKRGGVQEGFIILQINGLKIKSKDDINTALDNVKGGIIRIEGVYPNGMKMNYGFIL
jgi:serine protease Do